MEKNIHTEITWPETVFILIPAYNAAKDLAILLPSLSTIAPQDHICIVDDGSRDDTQSICRNHAVEYLKQETNLGKGAALKMGFACLLGKNAHWILTMDADGQHAVGDIPSFINAIHLFSDAGIIIGARSISLHAMPPARIFSNTVTSAILSLMCGCRIQDSQCGFRVYSSALLNHVSLFHNRFEMESEVILKACSAGFPVRFIPVQTLYCSTRSHISHLKDMFRWVMAVLKVWFTIKKLKTSNKYYGRKISET